MKIEKRYQYRSKSGIVWTKWFEFTDYESLEQFQNLPKITNKLLNEYRIV